LRYLSISAPPNSNHAELLYSISKAFTRNIEMSSTVYLFFTIIPYNKEQIDILRSIFKINKKRRNMYEKE